MGMCMRNGAPRIFTIWGDCGFPSLPQAAQNIPARQPPLPWGGTCLHRTRSQETHTEPLRAVSGPQPRAASPGLTRFCLPLTREGKTWRGAQRPQSSA